MLRFTDRNINPSFPRQVGTTRHFSPRFSSAKKAFLQTSLGTSRPLKFRLLVLLCAFNMISNVCQMIFPYMYFAHCIISFDTLLTVSGMFSHWAGESWSEICHFLCKYSHLYANIKWLLMSAIHKESVDQENCFHHGHRVSFLNIFKHFSNCKNKFWRDHSYGDFSCEQFLLLSVSFNLPCKRNNLCGKV